MNLAYSVYIALSTAVFSVLYPFVRLYLKWTGRFGSEFLERMGRYQPEKPGKVAGRKPRVWIHAVSVGEINVALPIIDALKMQMPECAVILSTATPHGKAVADECARSVDACVYAPVDFILCVRRALSAFRPDILVCLETEIWPNWIIQASRSGIRTALVNGRISSRSIQRYLKIRPLTHYVLEHIDGFSMISQVDADRIVQMGAPSRRVRVSGNAKYDRLFSSALPDMLERQKKLYRPSGQPVFVAGSIRGQEPEMLMNACDRIRKRFPELLMILAPRHVRRAKEIRAMVQARGISCQLRTELATDSRTAPVVVVDTIGELQALYGMASVVFCGGSLVALGGQNVLEAAIWAKPVIYGPYMEDFQDARDLLRRWRASIEVEHWRQLSEKVMNLLENPQEAQRIGQCARQAVLSVDGAAQRHATLIVQLLNEKQKIRS